MNELMRYRAQKQLVWQAEFLVLALAAELESAKGGERRIRLETAKRHAEDRASRRLDHYQRMLAGLPVVTTATVRGWMLAHLDEYRHGLDGVDCAEIAGAACAAFDLWDKHGSIPLWVYGLGEWAAARSMQEIERRMAFFVEKPIRYEADGDILWA